MNKKFIFLAAGLLGTAVLVGAAVVGVQYFQPMQIEQGTPYTQLLEEASYLQWERFNFDPKKPLEDRIMVFPNDAVSGLWYRSDIKPYAASPEARQAIADGFQRIMTPALQAFLEERLVGVGMGFTYEAYGGVMHPIISADGTPYFFLTVDVSVVSEIYWKDGRKSVIKPDSSRWTLNGGVPPDQRLDLVLLHEIGHGVDFIYGVTNMQGLAGLKTIPHQSAQNFGADLWKGPAQTTESFPAKYRYPFRQGLSASDIPGLVQFYAENALMSFYSSKAKAEDWAETWAYYHWITRLGKEDVLRVTDPQGQVQEYRAYDNPSARERMALAGELWKELTDRYQP